MNRINSNKLALVFIAIIAALFIGIVTLVVINNKQVESNLVVIPEKCVCYNCTNHTSGYIPATTVGRLCTYGEYWKLKVDWPEEPIEFGDTISTKAVNDSLFIGFFHSKYPSSFYKNCDIYIISE